MSEDKSVSNAAPEASGQEDKVVPRDAYEKVTQDMHKYKSKMKEYEAHMEQLRADLKAKEEAELAEQNRFKELYEKREIELAEAKKEAQRVRDQYLTTAKRAALKQELGGKIRDEYLSFADLNSIALRDDGSIDAESVRMVANEFRKQHGQLIPQVENASITGQAPANQTPIQGKDPKTMSSKELVEYYAKLKQVQ